MISVLTNFDAKKIMDIEGRVINRSNEESKSKAVIFA
jgi:hypothetical protein